MTFQGEVKAAGERAEAKTKAVIAGHEAVTQRTIADSNTKLSMLQAKADDALKAMQAQHASSVRSMQDSHAATVESLRATHISTTQQVTEGISNAYESKIASIRAAYADRLRKPSPDSGGGAVSTVSLSAPEAYDRSAYDYLAANCAITTQMLVSLQGWVREQGAVQ